MKKRILATLLSLCLVIGLLPVTAVAAEDTPVMITITPADMEQVTEDTTAIAAAVTRMQITDPDSITALKVTTEGTAYLSPADNTYIKTTFTSLKYLDESQCKCHTRTLEEYYSTRGGLNATAEYEEFGGLSEFTTLETLLIPESAQIINGYQVNKTGLTTLTIPNNVLVIESGTFSGNRMLTGDLVIPDSVVFIGNNAFGAGSSNLDSGTLKLGNSVKYIDNNGFARRMFTGNLVIPDSVEFIGNWVFSPGAFSGGTWTLGKNLKHVGDAAMSNICSGNEGTFVVPAGLEATDTSFGYNTFGKIIFEDGVTKVGTRIARDSKRLKEVVLPATVSTFGSYAFSSCTALDKVTLSEGIETSGNYTFSGCTSLHQITLPSTLTAIGTGSFENSGLYGVFISEKITSVAERAFMSLPEGSVVYLQTDALNNGMATDQGHSGYNRRYDAEKTALVMTNGGTFPNSTEFVLGALSEPIKAGYTFDGWYTSAEFTEGTKVENGIISKASNNKYPTYYAKWVSTINFDANGGSGGPMDAQVVTDGDSTTPLTENTFAKAGYTFDGWNTQADGQGTSYADKATDKPSGNTTLYAQWTPNTYTINFSGGTGASGSTTSVTATYDQPATLTANGFSVANKNFAGWATTENGTTVDYSNGAQVKNLTAEANGTVTLYAVWTDKQVLAPDKSVQTKTYNGVAQAFTLDGYTISYKQNGEVVTAPINAGTYDVVISADETNTTAAYPETLIPGGLVIEKATLTVTADNKTMYVSDALPTYTYTVSGWQGSDKDTATFTAPTLSCSADGKTAGTYTITASGATASENYTITYVDGTLTVYAYSSGGGSSSSSNTSTSTTTNKDGSTTTTTTNKTTGTVTEVTKEKDGTTTTVETKKDGTVTETVKLPDGTTGTVVTDKNGEVTEVKATVTSTAVKAAEKAGEAVTLPVEVPAAKTTEDAPAVQVTVPKAAGSVKVEIPVEKVTPGTVAVIVDAKGDEKIVATSVTTENGVALALDGSATVKIIDNAKSFADVPADHVFYNEVASLSAREIMVGKTDDKFDLHNSVTLNQIANVAGRIVGAVDVKDYNAGIAWGAEYGLKTGDAAATRGDVLKALYIAAGSPAVEDTSVLARFTDAASIPADLTAAAAWATQNGILKGNVDGSAGLGSNVTRGQACALAGRTMATLA